MPVSHVPSSIKKPTRKSPLRTALFLLGATLAVGCGGVEPEEMMDSPPAASEQPAPEDNVSAEEACCYVRCVDGATNRWRGPFRSVTYGNCANYGRYYCGQHHWPFLSSKFADC